MQVQNTPPVAPPAKTEPGTKPKIDSTLEKIGGAIHDNTKEGTFIGDNMLLTGAGTLVGVVAAGSAVKKTADAFPAVKEVLKTVFVDNGKLVGSGAALASSALLAEDAVASFKEGHTGRAVAEGAGATILGLGGVELTGRQFNIPVLNKALSGPAEATAKFLGNHGVGLVGGATAAGGAYLAKLGVDDVKEGDYLTGAAKLAGGGVAALGGAEIIGQAYDVGVLKGLVSTPAKKIAEVAVKNAGGIGGTAIAGAGAALAISGVKDLKEGETMLGGAKLAGSAIAGLGGAELVGRNYDIPVMKDALSGTAKWVGNNVKAVTGGVAAAGGVFATVDGIKRLGDKDQSKWLAGAEIAGGVVGTLGGAELVGRNFNIPVLNQALTGPVKFMFTSKGGIGVSGGVIAASGLGATADGVRRLTTQKGIVNDAVGVAEFTAGVAGVTGGASIIGFATGSEKLMKVFPENIDVLGGAALVGGAFAMGKHTLDSAKKDGVNLINTGTATASALMATGGTQIIVNKFGVEAANKTFMKGYETIAAAGLGVATYKLGEMAVKDAAAYVKDTDDVVSGLKAIGLGTAAVAAGTTATGLVGHAYNIPVLENAARKVLEKGWQPTSALVLGAATVKLGDMALDQGKKFIEKPGLDHGAAAVGLATAGVLTGAGATALVGKTFNIPGVERAGMVVLEKTATGVTTTGRYLGKGAEKVFNAAVQHPFATLG
ncbi:MAG TPA: hypothetical protein V6D23_01910, partial [Candidatus Obscuribacterales bacterium]